MFDENGLTKIGVDVSKMHAFRFKGAKKTLYTSKGKRYANSIIAKFNNNWQNFVKHLEHVATTNGEMLDIYMETFPCKEWIDNPEITEHRNIHTYAIRPKERFTDGPKKGQIKRYAIDTKFIDNQYGPATNIRCEKSNEFHKTAKIEILHILRRISQNYKKINMEFLREMQNGPGADVLRSIMFKGGRPLESITEETNYGEDENISDFAMHHFVVVRGRSAEKSSAEPSQYLYSKKFFEHPHIAREIMGCFCLSSQEHKKIHQRFRQSGLFTFPIEMWPWVWQSEENYNTFTSKIEGWSPEWTYDKELERYYEAHIQHVVENGQTIQIGCPIHKCFIHANGSLEELMQLGLFKEKEYNEEGEHTNKNANFIWPPGCVNSDGSF